MSQQQKTNTEVENRRKIKSGISEDNLALTIISFQANEKKKRINLDFKNLDLSYRMI